MMAAKASTSRDKLPPATTNVYTLPISCQICLGKVRQPVLCSNFHVFCGRCIDTWRQRSHRCPSCRVPIDDSNPVKHIRGGLHPVEDEEKEKSSPELRKTRFDLLYKDYEEIVEDLEQEVKRLRCENGRLKFQLSTSHKEDDGRGDRVQGGGGNQPQLQLLTMKLQDAQKLYDQVKQDISKVKKENHSLKDANINLTRENAKLREEISSRSPHKFGRLTVATLETQLESQKKEVQRLTRALERSDQYIESLQQQLDKLSTSTSTKDTGGNSIYTQSLLSSDLAPAERGSDTVNGLSTRRQLFLSNDQPGRGMDSVGQGGYDLNNGMTISSKLLPSSEEVQGSIIRKPNSSSKADSGGKEKSPGKKVHFNLSEKKSNDSSSFNLEVPSPIVPSTYSDSGKSSNKDLDNNRTQGTSQRPTIDWDRTESDRYSNNKLSRISEQPSPQLTPELEHLLKMQRKNDLSAKKEPSYSSGQATSALTLRHSEESSNKEQYAGFNTSLNLSEPDQATPQSLSELDHQKSTRGKSSTFSKHTGGSQDKKIANVSFDLEGPSLDDTQTIQTELKDLDISMTPELSDCMKLLNRAEKKVSHGEMIVTTTHTGSVRTGNTHWPHTSHANIYPTTDVDRHVKLEGRKAGEGGVGLGFPSSLDHPRLSPPAGLPASHTPGTYIPGTTGTMSGWEHGFFSSLRVNPYKHAVSHAPPASHFRQSSVDLHPPSSSNTQAAPTVQSVNAGSFNLLAASDEDFRRSLPAPSTKSSLSSATTLSTDGRSSALTDSTRLGSLPLSHLPSSSKPTLSSANNTYSKSSLSLGTLPSSGTYSSSIMSSSGGISSAGLLSSSGPSGLHTTSSLSSSVYTSSNVPASSYNFEPSHTRNSNHYSSASTLPNSNRNHLHGNHFAPSDLGLNRLTNNPYSSSSTLPDPSLNLLSANRSGGAYGDCVGKERKSNNYSYVSNTSSQGVNDSSHLDSFLPEPKKRLFDFESEEESDVATPSKATKLL